MPAEEEPTAYDILGVTLDVSDADLSKAYRSQALKVHPDRRPNDPVAGQKFHELTQAFELLQDATKRQALDEKIKTQQARKQRYAAHDSKRKAMLDELEDSERKFKRQRAEQAQAERAEMSELERIREESARLRKGRQPAAPAPAPEPVAQERPLPPLGPLDTTVRLKFDPSRLAGTPSKESLLRFIDDYGLGPYDRDAVVLSVKTPKSKSGKLKQTCTALVPFTSVYDAAATVAMSGISKLEGFTATWAGGEPPERLKVKKPAESPAKAGPTIPDPLESESETLMRLRQAERDKLKQEIRDAEA